MTDICQRQFRFLKFSFGPICPNPRCPGSSPDGKVLPLDPSSDESDDEADGNSTCDEASEGPLVDSRRHVICIDPAVPSKPLWCNSTPVHEFEEMKQWLVKAREFRSKNAHTLISNLYDLIRFGLYEHFKTTSRATSYLILHIRAFFKYVDQHQINIDMIRERWGEGEGEF